MDNDWKNIQFGTEEEIKDPYILPKPLQAQLIDSNYCGRVVAAALWRKFLRKFSRKLRGIQPVAMYNGLLVFDDSNLDGGGMSEGQNYLRTLLGLGLGPCERVFEFAAGPGYVGYSLLANGFCRTIALSDVNPAAVKVARVTAEYNRMEHLVTVYESDALDSIPASEQWDVVVGSAPFSMAPRSGGDLRWEDPEYSLKRRFYANVKQFMKPGGHVVMMEGITHSKPDVFVEMIEKGGGRVVNVFPAVAFNGDLLCPYYMVSRW